jgi:hypothetical protein
LDSDGLLVFGIFLALLSVPMLISAFSSDRSIRGASAFAVVGGILIVMAYATKPDSYRPDDIPRVIVSVLARIVN